MLNWIQDFVKILLKFSCSEHLGPGAHDVVAEVPGVEAAAVEDRPFKLPGGRRVVQPAPFLEVPAATRHSFGGSFSAGSKLIFASKCAFCSIFQNVQETHFLASKFCKFLPKMSNLLQIFVGTFKQILRLEFFKNPACIHKKNPQKFSQDFSRMLQKFVDLEKC